MNRLIFSALAATTLLISCSQTSKTPVAVLATETDSLAYVIGVSIADNLMAMDSTINIAAVCRAISEQTSTKSKPLLSRDQAREYYLRYITFVKPEQKRGYEEQYLEDMVKSSRDFTRSNSGLTYNIAVIGDEEFTPRRVNDLVSIRYRVSRMNGEEVFSSYTAGDTLSIALKELLPGVQESVKMIGKGGKVNAWMPSKLAYGEQGDPALDVEPFETLYFEIEVIDMVVNGAR